MTTLTSATGACETITARRTESIDAENIKNLHGAPAEAMFGRVNLVNLIERAVLGITIINDKDEIMAHGNFNDYPNPTIPISESEEWPNWLANSYDLKKCTPLNTLFLHYFVAVPGFTQGCAKEIIRTAFNAVSDLHYIVLLSPLGVFPETALTNLFEDVACIEENKLTTCSVFMCKRYDHVPTLHVRMACVEDHDDLTPIFERQSDMLSKTYGDYFLAELIEAQDDNMKCIVTEVEGFAVGFMSVCSDVNLDLLNNCFELEPFNGLHKPDQDDETQSPPEVVSPPQSARGQTREGSVKSGEGERGTTPTSKQGSKQGSTPNSKPGTADSKNKQEVDDNKSVKSGASKKSFSIDDEDPVNIKPALSNSQLGDSQSQQGLTDHSDENSIKSAVVKRSPDSGDNRTKISRPPTPKSRQGSRFKHTYHGDSNAVCIQLFCIDERYEMRSCDFLPQVFELFPDREYIVITVPHLVPEIPLLQQFVRVTPRSTSTLPQELYIFNRAGLLNTIEVRKACTSDYEGVEKLVAPLNKKEHLLKDLQAYNTARRDVDGTNLRAFVALCNSQLVGVAILRKEEDVEYIRSHYNIEDFIYYNHHRRSEHAHLYHLTINPVFKHYTKHFIKEILRQGQATSLYYPIYPPYVDSPPNGREHTLISSLGDMVPVRPRRQIVYPVDKLGRNAPSDRILKEELPYALYHINRKLTMEPKVSLNARIVVVGASDTGLSFLETLAFCPHLRFHNLTLISPHGLPGELPPCVVRDNMLAQSHCYMPREHNQLSLRTWVNVVYGKMTAIDRKKKHVVVDGQFIVPYDHLVITTGVQYDIPSPTEANITALATSSEAPYSPERRYEGKQPKNVFIVNNTYQAAVALNWIEENVLENTGDVIVYGLTLDVYCAIQSMVNLGISGKRIVLVEPPVTFQTTCFNNHPIEKAVARALKDMGVRVHSGFLLAQWNQGQGGEYIPLVRSASFTSSTKPITISCEAFLTYYKRVVDGHAFRAVNDACLVFDGRMVIDANFHTNDVAIRAAGPFTKYQRIYHADQWTNANFNSREIGVHLANVMLALFDPSLEPEASPPEDLLKLIPVYRSPKIQGGVVPGGYNYLHIQKPSLESPLDVQMSFADYGRVLLTGKPSDDPEYFRLHINSFNSVQTITCLAKKPFSISNFICLFGLHERYLNNLCSRFDEGLITDLYGYFKETWALAIYHDRFGDFREEIRELLTTRRKPDEESFEETIRRLMEEDEKLGPEQKRQALMRFEEDGFKRSIETRLLSLLSYNYYHLPMYAKPGMV